MENTTRTKVLNPNKFHIGIRLYDGRTMNIVPKGFQMLTADEIHYVASATTLFSRGLLRVEEAAKPILEEAGVIEENNVCFMTDEEMKKKLGLSAAKLGAWLADITDEIVLNRLAEIAKSMDLATSKMKVIEAKYPKAFMADD